MNATARAMRDRGSITLEVAILAPALLMLLSAMVIAGRIEVAASGVEHAAATAAREASLARTADHARTVARAAADRELADQACTTTTVDLDLTGFTAPMGQPAAVTVTITCTAAFDDLAIPGLPGSRTLTGMAASPLDAWRQR